MMPWEDMEVCWFLNQLIICTGIMQQFDHQLCQDSYPSVERAMNAWNKGLIGTHFSDDHGMVPYKCLMYYK